MRGVSGQRPRASSWRTICSIASSKVILDLRFQYIFDLPREGNLGLFWEIFNATGRVNFGNPTGNRRSANFLVPVSAGDLRTMQLGIRYSF